jgi:hypothetical protein
MANFEDEIDPAAALKVIEARVQRMCGEALDNFCIARALAAQGQAEMAEHHMGQVHAMNTAIGAVLALKDRYQVAEVPHGHPDH